MITMYYRSLQLILLGLLHFIIPSLAIYEHQAGTFDWHHTWIGHPRAAFNLDNKHIAVYSESNVFASINVESGEIAWRQVLDNVLDQFVATNEGVLTLTSNPERTQFWNKTDGSLIWEYTLPENQVFGSANPVVWDNGDVALFIERTKFVKLSNEGKEIWSWTRTTNKNQLFETIRTVKRGDIIYAIIDPDDEAQKPFFSIVAIDGETGQEISTTKVPCDMNYDNIGYIGNYLFWTEEHAIKWTSIEKVDIKSTSLKALVESFPTAEHFVPSQISLIGEPKDAELSSFVISAEYEAGDSYYVASALINIDGNTLTPVKYFGEENAYGGVDFFKETSVRVVRSAPEEFTVHVMPEEKEIKIKHNFDLSGGITYAKVVSAEPFRLFVVTESSSVFLYNESSILWSREEALSAIASSEFLDLPEQKLWTQMADELGESVEEQAVESPVSRYIRRLTNHALELRQFPGWIVSHFIGMSGSTLKETNNKISNVEAQSCWLNQTGPEVLYRDNFGLHKLLISATRSGKIIAQDTSRNGKIVWSRFIPGFSFKEVHVVRTAAVKLPPVIVAIGSTWDDVGGQATGFVRLNGLTGEDYISHVPETQGFFEPVVATGIGVDKVMRLPIEDPDEKTHMLAIYEAGSGRVYIYPDTNNARIKFLNDFLPEFYFSYQKQDGELIGYKVVEGYRGSLKAEPIWNLELPDNEEPVTLSHRQPYEKVASLGRALGNRNVLYKYLNPHMFAIVTADNRKSSMKVRIVDSVKGSILYETLHENVDTQHNKIHILQSENWFIYHFWSNDNKARGYQTAVLELYEGEHENEYVESDTFSSFDNIQPHVLSSAFAFPYPITTMGITTTRNGISTKNILFALPSHQIMAVNKRLFDPRRPTDKPSKEDQEEQLFPYGPIPDDKRLFLTYGLDVAKISSIITSPSLLESTSLVFAYGFDTFFTRSSPSRQFDVLSEDFSKVQLLLTITGLAAGIWVTGPMVRKKRVNALWK